MNRLFLVVALMLGLTSGMQAQTKLGLSLNHIVQSRKALQAKSAGGNATGEEIKLETLSGGAMAETSQTVDVIAQLEDGSSLPESKLQELGITVHYHKGNFAFLTVPVESLSALDGMSEIVSIEENQLRKLNNNKSREATKVVNLQDETKAAAAGLPQTYTGKGVVVGVFDTGIDFNHNNFRNPATTTHETRIKKALVYSGTNGTPTYKYTNPSDIDKLTTDNTSETHGTHTCSTAAGSYAGSYFNTKGTVTYTGVHGAATEADLVLAGGPLSDSNIMNGINEMDATATELNEPLVVNLSLGSTGGWLDGKDTFGKFCDDLTGNGDKPGRIVCISAGNDGASKFSIKGTLNSSNNRTIKTFISTTTYNSTKYFLPYVRVYGKDGTKFTVQLEFYNSSFVKQSTVTSSTLYNNGYLSYGTYSSHDGRYAATLYVYETSYACGTDKYYCAVTVTSDSDCEINLFGMDIAGNNYDLTDKGRSGFTAGTADLSINTMACTNSVLSVGAWVSHNGFTSYGGSNLWYGKNGVSTVGSTNDIATFSSYTTCDDKGVQRPDFAAPGVSVVSGYNSYNTSYWSSGTTESTDICGKASEEYVSGHTSIIGAMCGTSMACPNAVGIIALWLQKNPNLTVNQIREIIKNSADNDNYTAAAPVRFGAGKINALTGIQAITEEKVVYRKDYDYDGDNRLDSGDVTKLAEKVFDSTTGSNTKSIVDVTKLVNYLQGK